MARGTADRLLGLIREVHDYASIDEYRSEIVGSLRRAVPSDWSSYNEFGEHPEDYVAVVDPVMTTEQVETFNHWAHEHPLVERMRFVRDGRPLRMSDVIDKSAFHELGLYREFFGPLGVESQVAFTLPSRAPSVYGMALSRGLPDYGDDDLRLIEQARPHLIQAYRNTQLADSRKRVLDALEGGLEAAGQMIVVIDRRGLVQFATEPAKRLLASVLGPFDGKLPELVRDWIAAHRRRDPAQSAEPLVLGAGEQAVLVRLLPGRTPGAPDVLLLEAGAGGMSVAALSGLGLTTREAEALRWVALGRTAPEAARLMGISPRTMSKHLQNVYGKLGVSSRSQAAATAWAAVGVVQP